MPELSDSDRTLAGLIVLWLLISLPLAAWLGSPLIIGAPFILLFVGGALLELGTSIIKRLSTLF